MTNKVCGKPYSKGIKEDLAPYLVAVMHTPEEKTNFKYIFNVCCAPTYINNAFIELSRNLKCWKQVSRYRVVWHTDSDFLNKMYKNGIVGGKRRSAVVNPPWYNNPCMEIDLEGRTVSEAYDDIKAKLRNIEDIPIEGAGDSPYSVSGTISTNGSITIDNEMLEILGEFKTKENKMNKDKFKVSYTMDIYVNGEQFTLYNPANANTALEAVLALNTRMDFLKGQVETLMKISEANGDTDAVSTNKVTEVVTDEIDEIRETIQNINELLESAD